MAGATYNREQYKVAIPQLDAKMKEILDNNVIIERQVVTINQTIESLDDDYQYFKNLTTGYLKGIVGDFEYGSFRQASITDLTTVKAHVGELIATEFSAEDIVAIQGYIQTATAGTITAGTIDAKTAEFETLMAEDFTADQIKAASAAFRAVSVGELSVAALKTQYAEIDLANIDFANVGIAKIGELFSRSGTIGNLSVESGTVTGRLVGVTIVGDLIEAGTVKADKLVVLGSDGLYYKLNVDGETVEANQTDYNSINGSHIQAQSITASKVTVSDLVAFGADIAGLKMASGKIYSIGKSTIDSAANGLYLDSDGQLNTGNATNFVKSWYDETEAKWKVAIRADEISFGTGTSVSDAIENARLVAENYLTDVTSDGVFIHESGAASTPDTGTGVHISSAIDIIKSGVSHIKAWVENNIPKVRIGIETAGHVVLDNDSMEVKEKRDTLASFGEKTVIGRIKGNPDWVSSAAPQYHEDMGWHFLITYLTMVEPGIVLDLDQTIKYGDEWYVVTGPIRDATVTVTRMKTERATGRIELDGPRMIMRNPDGTETFSITNTEGLLDPTETETFQYWTDTPTTRFETSKAMKTGSNNVYVNAERKTYGTDYTYDIDLITGQKIAIIYIGLLEDGDEITVNYVPDDITTNSNISYLRSDHGLVGDKSIALGEGTKAYKANNIAVGKYNNPYDQTMGGASLSLWNLPFSVGTGTDDNNRYTSFAVKDNTAIVFGRSASYKEASLTAFNTDSLESVSLQVGAGGTNRGVYLPGIGWMIYYDGSETRINNLAVDSGSCTIASGWANYESGQGPIIRKQGSVVSFYWQCKPTSSKTIDATRQTVCTIPSGYRPPRMISKICQGTGTRVFEMTVQPNGNVQVARLRNTNSTSYDTADSSYWFPLHMTWITD